MVKSWENPRFHLFVYFDFVTLLTFGIVAHWCTCRRSLCSNYNCKNWTTKQFLRFIKMFNIQNLRLYYVKICGKRLFHDLVNNCPSLEMVKTWNHKGHCILLLFYLLSFQKEAVLKFLKIPSEPATVDFCFSCRA